MLVCVVDQPAHFFLGEPPTVNDGAWRAVAERAIGEVKHQATAKALLRLLGRVTHGNASVAHRAHVGRTHRP
jgi:hypothetical protein